MALPRGGYTSTVSRSNWNLACWFLCTSIMFQNFFLNYLVKNLCMLHVQLQESYSIPQLCLALQQPRGTIMWRQMTSCSQYTCTCMHCHKFYYDWVQVLGNLWEGPLEFTWKSCNFKDNSTCENAFSQVQYGRWTLWVMGSCYKWYNVELYRWFSNTYM